MPATEIAWIADTGSAHDLVSRHMLHTGEVSQSPIPVSLLTANGVFQATDQARVNVPILGDDINPYVLSMTVQLSCLWDNTASMPDGASTGPLIAGHTSRNQMGQRLNLK